MKKFLLATAALVSLASQQSLAADLPVKVPYVAPVWSWTGFYIGGHIGGAWERKEWQTADGVLAGLVPFNGIGQGGGVISGGQVGFNYQSGAAVFGLELEGTWADIDGDAKCAIALFQCNARTDWMGSFTARLGYAGIDRMLLYVKGGGGWAHDKYGMTAFNFTNIFAATETRGAWVVGAGVEYAFTTAWSAKLEYEYFGLGSRSVAFTDQFANRVNVGIDQNIHTVKVGINYRFDWGAPVVAKY
jgi:opacity protein-like surface antigen